MLLEDRGYLRLPTFPPGLPAVPHCPMWKGGAEATAREPPITSLLNDNQQARHGDRRVEDASQRYIRSPSTVSSPPSSHLPTV